MEDLEGLAPAQQIGEVAAEIESIAAPVLGFVERAPALALGASALIAGILISLGLHWIFRRMLLRIVRGAAALDTAAVSRTAGLTRLAFVLAGMRVTLPAANLPPDWLDVIRHGIAVALIVLVGWTLMTIVNRSADRSLRRWIGADEDNVQARKNKTQVRMLRRLVNIMIFLITAGACLLTFESVQDYGATLFASAGVAGIVAAYAARPLLVNLIAGLQLAMTQPIRIDDVVIVEGEWGWIEEITATYVVVRIWDWRRLVLPISYFIEQPFENWTRESGAIIGSVTLYVDYHAPFDAMRAKFDELTRASANWDGQVSVFQVIGATERTVEVRALMSARSSPRAWELRCEVREKMLNWLRERHPEALPRGRDSVVVNAAGGETGDGPGPVYGAAAE